MLVESWLRGRDLNPRPSGYECFYLVAVHILMLPIMLICAVLFRTSTSDRFGQPARKGTTRHASCHHLSPHESQRFLVRAVNRRHILRIFRGDYALYSPETCVAQA